MRTGSCRRPSRRMRRPSGRRTGCRDNHHVVQDQVREIRQDLPRKYYLELPKLADGPAGRLSARLRLRARAHHPHRGPPRSADARRLRDRVSARGAADHRRNLGHPDHAAPGAGRRAAPARRRCRGGAPQPRSRARVGRAAEYRRRRSPNGSSTRCCATRRKRAAACRPPSSSSCCTGCAISPRRPRRRGTRCSARSKARATRPTKCCASSTSARPPGSWRSANIITTMRLLSSIDWPLFFERVSLVEQMLREDPAGAYARMDFPTRDRYRHSVEELARAARASEQDVARARGRPGGGGAADVSRPGSHPSRRLLPDLARTLPARGEGGLPADAARPLRALLLRPSRPRLPRHDQPA